MDFEIYDSLDILSNNILKYGHTYTFQFAYNVVSHIESLININQNDPDMMYEISTMLQRIKTRSKECLVTRNYYKKVIQTKIPHYFDLEIINIVTCNFDVSKKYNLYSKSKDLIDKIYGVENQLIMDAVDHDVLIFEKSSKIYSNAIFSLSNKIFGSPSLLVFGSKDKHFVDNKAYELILFFSNVVQEKLNQFSYE